MCANELIIANAEQAIGPAVEQAEKTATFMAREFSEATAEIGRLMSAIDAQTMRLGEAFRPAEGMSGIGFGIDFEYSGRRYAADRNDGLFDEMKRRAWRVLIDHMGIRNVMSVKTRKEFEQQLERGELPDITEEAITSIILGLAHQAKDFAKDAAKEVFDILRPRGPYSATYATNDAFRVGRKVILVWYVEAGYRGAFRTNYNRTQELVAIDGVFHLLDGKGVMREHRGPLVKAIEESPSGRGETDYFRFKCYKNRNLHLEMKRLDLVKELNGLAAGEHVLGQDVE